MPSYQAEFWSRLFWFIKITPADFVTYPNLLAELPIIISMEVIFYVIAALVLYHAIKRFGIWKAILFFAGSFLYTGLEENLWILGGYLGSQGIPFFLSGTVIPTTYYFNYFKYFLWFGAVPISVCLGWFFVAYGTFFIAEKVLNISDTPNTKDLVKASAIAGLLAMNFDLMIDPFMVRNGSWMWVSTLQENFYVLGIPFTNFVGWFLLIFLFSIFWTKTTDLEEKYGKPKATAIHFIGLAGLLLGTIYFVMLLGFLLTPLFGINISIPGIYGGFI
ncbi:MAG: carotenoid biosynthesis protein [Candidatus Lokiarchaeota archaeon]|nr:carotenoid biosynthesis protein [Candidatus Lokiarchaeota archaeon]